MRIYKNQKQKQQVINMSNTSASSAVTTAKSFVFKGTPKQISAEVKSKHGIVIHQAEISVLTKFGSARKIGELPKAEKSRGRASCEYEVKLSSEQIKNIKASQDSKQANKIAKATQKANNPTGKRGRPAKNAVNAVSTSAVAAIAVA